MLHHFHIFFAFLGTRQGKLILLGAVSLIGAGYLFTSPEKEQVTKEAVSKKNSVWAEDYNDPDTAHRQVKKYDSFVAFVPKPPKREITKVETPASVENPVNIPKPTIPIKLQAPLIKMQRTPGVTIEEGESPNAVKLPPLELGATLNCQLSTPAATDNPNSPVIAVVTRPLIRDGITIIPRGSKLFGKVQSSSNNRIFFAQNWTLVDSTGEPRSISGNAQERAYDELSKQLLASDGGLGLTGSIVNEARAEKLGPKILGTVVKGIAQLGKQTVTTSFGEIIPTNGRNAAITGGSAIIDQALAPNEQETIKAKPYVSVPAGKKFYLVVSQANSRTGLNDGERTIDQLLKDSLNQRLRR
ncbi:TrbI/VirB10 family protein [bacterium]|nr:TrbI/VirB10 family protein [bacterium]